MKNNLQDENERKSQSHAVKNCLRFEIAPKNNTVGTTFVWRRDKAEAGSVEISS